MSDLTAFLLARIAEDEAAEQEARRWSDRDWNVHGDSIFADHAEPILRHYSSDIVPAAGVLDHVARWDPARVRAECEAKRRIVDAAATAARGAEAWTRERLKTDTRSPLPEWARGDAFRETLRLLALPYADHPDYREEWRP